MKPVKKMKPGDYPLFAFRLTKERKDELDELLESVVRKINGGLEEDDRRVPKNEILFEALKSGLSRLSKRA